MKAVKHKLTIDEEGTLLCDGQQCLCLLNLSKCRSCWVKRYAHAQIKELADRFFEHLKMDYDLIIKPYKHR